MEYRVKISARNWTREELEENELLSDISTEMEESSATLDTYYSATLETDQASVVEELRAREGVLEVEPVV